MEFVLLLNFICLIMAALAVSSYGEWGLLSSLCVQVSCCSSFSLIFFKLLILYWGITDQQCHDSFR